MLHLDYEQSQKHQSKIFDSNFLKQQSEENELDKKTVEIKTICRDCIFAEFNEEYTKQTGCKLNRLSKFAAAGLIKDLYDEKTGLISVEIQRFCNACRNSEWASKYEDPEDKLKKEIELRLDFIVIDNEKESWEDDIISSCKSLVNQTIKPRKIIILFYRSTKPIVSLREKIISLLKETNIKYEIVNVLRSVPNINNVIDEAITKSNSQYYTLCDAGDTIDNNFIEKLNKLLNEDLVQFSMIEPTEGRTGLTVQRLIHKLISGNYNVPVTEKIKTIAKNQNVPHMVKNLQDI
jgi:hypothetical protein